MAVKYANQFLQRVMKLRYVVSAWGQGEQWLWRPRLPHGRGGPIFILGYHWPVGRRAVVYVPALKKVL